MGFVMVVVGNSFGLEIAMKKPSKKKLHGMLSTVLKKQVERDKRKESLSPQMRDTGFACVIPRCKGKIVEEVSYRHLGSDMEMPIGPISPSRYTRVRELYCTMCGLSYHHPPKKRQ
jgi:hypothetical protein